MRANGNVPVVVPIPREVCLGEEVVLAGPHHGPTIVADDSPYTRRAAAIVADYLGSRPDSKRGEIAVSSLETNPGLAEQISLPANPEAYHISVTAEGGQATVRLVGRSPRACIHAAHTFLATVRREGGSVLAPKGTLTDWPELEQRGILVAVTWYTGYSSFRYDSILWGLEEWKKFVDWASQYKFNFIAFSPYGYWPFPLESYQKAVLRGLEFQEWDIEKGEPKTVRWTHPNVEKEFFPELIRYAHQLGIKCYLQAGLNSYDGGYLREYEAKAAILNGQQLRYAEACWSDPKNRQYLATVLKEIFARNEFDGIIFEGAESGFCECDECTEKYRRAARNENLAKLEADIDWFLEMRQAIRSVRPHAEMGLVYHWGWQTFAPTEEYESARKEFVPILATMKERLPNDVFFPWLPSVDREGLKLWVDTFGPGRCLHYIYASHSWDRAPLFHGSDRDMLTLEFSIRETQAAARAKVKGVEAEAIEPFPHELLFLAVAQYSWNPEVVPASFMASAAKSLYGRDGERILEATRYLNRFPLAGRNARLPGTKGHMERVFLETADPLQHGTEMLRAAIYEGEKATELLEGCSGEDFYFPVSFAKMKVEARRKALTGRLLLNCKEALAHAEKLGGAKRRDYGEAQERARRAQSHILQARAACSELHQLLCTFYPLMYPGLLDRKLILRLQDELDALARRIHPFRLGVLSGSCLPAERKGD